MTGLEANIYNRQVGRSEPKVKLWSSAGLMLTYRCPSRCACCYVYCGPERAADEEEMAPELAVGCWLAIRRLAGERGQVHLTGGEPFWAWERLVETLRLAGEAGLVGPAGLAGLEKVETNGHWCRSEEQVRGRFERLAELGVRRLQVSTDVYHEQWVPRERVELAVRIGRAVFGEEQVQVRWRDWLAEPSAVDYGSAESRLAGFRAALVRRPERLVGRAADELSGLLPSRPAEHYAEERCTRAVLGARHVHVDGAGRVFAGTCAGIILGKVGLGSGQDLEALWSGFDYRAHPVFARLVEGGPFALAQWAAERGYRPGAGYASKCHLCYEVRRWLYRRGELAQWLGPRRCYGQTEMESARKTGLDRQGG